MEEGRCERLLSALERVLINVVSLSIFSWRTSKLMLGRERTFGSVAGAGAGEFRNGLKRIRKNRK